MLVWPGATVLVLAVLFGLWVLFSGIQATFFAWSMASAASSKGRGPALQHHPLGPRGL